ncbi:MAG: 2-hydroxyglutaryl-CoA dehydratase [Chloroflexi bacterium]|nr:2-hydroxyglutaryl-CoA dehydratase [Chloroflexota bacterium]
MNTYYIGIDIGSHTSKGVVRTSDRLVAMHIAPSGINYRLAADELRKELYDRSGIAPGDRVFTVATGIGARNVRYSDIEYTDMRCSARGINRLFPSARTVIEVQTQSSRVMRLNETGQVINSASSEKCASGSGRFLEVIAHVVQVDIRDIGPLSLQSRNPVAFTTSCAVFGESEAISRVAEGILKEDILAGVHQALATKIVALTRRVGLESDCAIAGGAAMDLGLVRSIEEKLGVRLLVPPEPRIVTALGAAVLAEETGTSQQATSGG